jgi:hypothetical protein
MATKLQDTVYVLDNRSVLRPEDLLSDPAGETVFLPPAGELSGLFQAKPSEAADWPFWPGFSP